MSCVLVGVAIGVGSNVGDGIAVGMDVRVCVSIEVNVGTVVVPQDTVPLIRTRKAISRIIVFFINYNYTPSNSL